MRSWICFFIIGIVMIDVLIVESAHGYYEDFSTEPGWRSTEPDNVKWDLSGFYRARVSDNPSGFVQWGYSPLFQEVSNSSLSFEFDVNPIDPSYGTYPGIHLIEQGVADPFVDRSIGVDVDIADEFPGNFVIQGKSYGGSSQIYFSSPQFTVGQWYHHKISYDQATKNLNWQISEIGMPEGSFYSNTFTNIAIAPFAQVVIGYQSDGPVYGGWAESYFDNIEIVPEPTAWGFFILGGTALLRRRRT